MKRRLLLTIGAGAILALAGGASWLYSLGPLPRVDEAGFSTEGVDREGRARARAGERAERHSPGGVGEEPH